MKIMKKKIKITIGCIISLLVIIVIIYSLSLMNGKRYQKMNMTPSQICETYHLHPSLMENDQITFTRVSKKVTSYDQIIWHQDDLQLELNLDYTMEIPKKDVLETKDIQTEFGQMEIIICDDYIYKERKDIIFNFSMHDIAYSGTFQRTDETELVVDEDVLKIITMRKACILLEA